jgi:hypothetical protein
VASIFFLEALNKAIPGFVIARTSPLVLIVDGFRCPSGSGVATPDPGGASMRYGNADLIKFPLPAAAGSVPA